MKDSQPHPRHYSMTVDCFRKIIWETYFHIRDKPSIPGQYEIRLEEVHQWPPETEFAGLPSKYGSDLPFSTLVKHDPDFPNFVTDYTRSYMGLWVLSVLVPPMGKASERPNQRRSPRNQSQLSHHSSVLTLKPQSSIPK